MNNLAIPATPPPAAANSGSGATSKTSDERFDDTLRKTQDQPEKQAHSGAAGDTATSAHVDHKSGTGNKDAAKKDEHAGKQADTKDDDHLADGANAAPIAAAVVALAQAAVRQTPAVGGKTLPAATTPAAGIATGSAKPAPARATPVPATSQASIAPATVADAKLSHLAQPPGLATGTQVDPGDGKSVTTAHDEPNPFTAHLSQLIGAHSAAPTQPAPAPVQLTMQATPQQQPQFAQETAQQVAWLAGKGIDKAEIQLNPSKLGPIHVAITNHHDRVDVSFAVQHPQTVHALQQTLPQLHDMLAQQGLNLGQASVGQQSPGQQHAAFAQHHAGGNANGGSGGAENDVSLAPRTLRIATPGRVDDFA